MENIISNKTSQDLQIEEYDKTDSFDTSEMNLSDEGTQIDEKGKKSLKQVLEKQLPFLANIFKSKKPKKDIDAKVQPDKKPKAKITPIHIIVILGLLVFLFLDEEEEVAKAPKLNPIKKERPKEVVAKEPLKDEVIEKTVVPDQGLDGLKVSDQPVEARDNTINDIPDIDDTEFPTNNEGELSDLDLGIDRSKPSAENNTPDISEDIVSENTNDQTYGAQDNTQDLNPVENNNIPDVTVPSREDSFSQDIATPDNSNDVTQKLLENLEVKLKEERVIQDNTEELRATEAPAYDAIGSGLVYNCTGGHWACIDLEEYKNCRGNYSWNKNKGYTIECYPSGYFKTDFDCSTVQQEKVNSVPDLSFCR